MTAAWVAIAPGHAACTATNFLDPEGPRYYDTSRSTKPDEQPSDGGNALRLVTFNIEHGREIDGAVRLIRTNETLRDPDILLLQEMSSEGVARMAGELGLNYLCFPSGIHPQARQEWGTAILSPWRIEEPAKLVLPHGAAITGMRRAATVATVRWRGRPIRVYSVHLPSPMAISTSERQAQVRTILEAARAAADPVIVAGDFNSSAVGPWFQQDRFAWITQAVGGTSRPLGLRFQLDHVFARGLGLAGGVPAIGCVEAPGVSDHCAVWARLSVLP